MFYHIDGVVTELGQNLAVIDCAGIGFAINVSSNSLSRLQAGHKAKLYISEVVGETNFDLYGFAEKGERSCFEMLISVSGIGPKAAMSILSYNTPEALTLAIINNDLKALTVAPGVGKKIAQRVVLELKDKVGKDFEISLPQTAAAVQAIPAGDRTMSDAMAALAVLGYSSSEIAPVIKNLDLTGLSSEQIIKTVLKQMVR